jgi:hypothetical protein
MFDILMDICRVNTFTTCVVLALTGWGALLLNIATSSPHLSLSFVPGMGFGALAMIYTLSQLGITFTPYSDANIVIGATFGLVVGFLFMVVLIRLVTWAMDLRRPVVKNDAAPARSA